MAVPPTTRHSLILRLRDREDAESWREFARIYEPVIYRLATVRGLQHADALELVQRVLLAVARSVDRFQPDQHRAKFRTWLYRIAHNEFCEQYAACRKDMGTGDSAVQGLLAAVPAPSLDEFATEYRRTVFRVVAEQVRHQVQPPTWRAFWRTAVDNEPVEAVASEMGLSVGAIYVARSRVMSRLQQAALKYENAT